LRGEFNSFHIADVNLIFPPEISHDRTIEVLMLQRAIDIVCVFEIWIEDEGEEA
jgi:hypothetical protein